MGFLYQEGDTSCGHSPTKTQKESHKRTYLGKFMRGTPNPERKPDQSCEDAWLIQQLVPSVWQDKMAIILQKTFPNAFSNKEKFSIDSCRKHCQVHFLRKIKKSFVFNSIGNKITVKCLIKIQTFSYRKMSLKMSPAKWWPLLSGPQCIKFVPEGSTDDDLA